MWQSINTALDRKERRSKFIWYWLASGVLLIVVAGGMLQWNSQSNNNTAKVTAKNDGVAKRSKESNKSAITNNPSVKSNSTAQLEPSVEINNSVPSNHSNKVQLHSVDVISKSLPSINQVLTDKNGGNLFRIQPNSLNYSLGDLNGLANFGLEVVLPKSEVSSELTVGSEKLAWNIAPKTNKVLGRWSLEVGADANQTGLTYRAKSDYANYIHKNYFDRMKSGEFAMSASRIQGALTYQLTSKHSVKLGVSYAENRTQQNFEFHDSMPATVIQGQTADALGYYPIFGYLGLGPQVTFSGQSTYTMLSIPLGYSGHFPIGKNVFITPEVLISANRLGVSAGAQTLDYQTLMQKSQIADQFRTWVMGARLAMGVEKRLNYSNTIGLRFNAQSMLSPMYIPNAALESRGWSVGLSAHYSWRIH